MQMWAMRTERFDACLRHVLQATVGKADRKIRRREGAVYRKFTCGKDGHGSSHGEGYAACESWLRAFRSYGRRKPIP